MSKKSRKTSKTSNKTNVSLSNSTLWPEWSDDKINIENWSALKGSGSKFFEDPHAPILPLSLKPHSWKRPHLMNNTEPVLYIPSSIPSDLFINNQHILHCQFIRWFISALTTLHYHGREGLRIVESPNFTWKLKNKPWKGWYYIYSLNKIERKSQHNPLFNPYGKYIVRLFFYGTWRSIEVDDLIPLDKDENPLLPRTENNQELWPIILAKAMLKIISTVWKSSEDEEIKETDEPINVNLIYLLTGWTCLSLDISHLYPHDQWELLSQYVLKFTESDILGDDSSIDKSDKTSTTSIEDSDDSKKSRKKSKASSTASIGTLKKKKEEDEVDDCDVLTLLVFKETEDDQIFADYPIHAQFLSDISLDPTQAKSPLENWKRHRWFCWASQQGVMNPIDYTIPTRLALLFTPFLYYDQSQSSLSDLDKNSNRLFTWFDFNELSGYAVKIIFLFKTKKFKYSINISDIIETDPLNNDKKLFRNYHYDHQPVGLDRYKSFANEPLYFLTDSLEPKFFMFNFNVFPGSKKESCLIVQTHHWFYRVIDKDPLLMINAIMSSSKVLALDPGRHLLKIFVHSPDSYHLTIQSNTFFEVGNREQIQDLMTTESEISKKFTQKIKQCMISAFDAFGSSNYPERLRAYYQSYLPEDKTMNKILSSITHQLFRKALINFVKKKIIGDDLKCVLQSLRIFFIDPTIGRYNLYYPEQLSDYNQYNSIQVPSLENIYEKIRSYQSLFMDWANRSPEIKAVKTIQASWRMLRIKRYLNIHRLESNAEKRKEIKQYLELISAMLKEGLTYDIVRDFLRKGYGLGLSDFYPIRNEFLHILNLTKIKGKISVDNARGDLLPIFRLFAIIPENSTHVFASLNLSIDLPRHYLCVFSNDTCREIEKHINKVLPYHYRKNRKGYTIFCYAWINGNDDEEDSNTSINKRKSLIAQKKEFEWTLHVMSPKGDPEFIFVNNIGISESTSPKIYAPDLEIKEISNNYIPKRSKKIFRIVIKTSRSCSIALRVMLSCEKILMRIKLIDSRNKIVENFWRLPGELIPTIFLGKKDLFHIEAIMMNKSWPLTEKERNTLLDVKEKKSYQYISSKMNNSTAGGSMDNDDQQKVMTDGKKQALEAPYWIVHAVINKDEILEIYEDTSEEQKIQQLKESWFANDPSRLEKGRVIRENYLQKLDPAIRNRVNVNIDILNKQIRSVIK